MYPHCTHVLLFQNLPCRHFAPAPTSVSVFMQVLPSFLHKPFAFNRMFSNLNGLLPSGNNSLLTKSENDLRVVSPSNID